MIDNGNGETLFNGKLKKLVVLVIFGGGGGFGWGGDDNHALFLSVNLICFYALSNMLNLFLLREGK